MLRLDEKNMHANREPQKPPGLRSILAWNAKMPEHDAVDMFQQLTTFVRIAEAGSISRAARSLGLSVAMTSRQLRALEEELGVELMRRTTRRMDLTEPGEELLARARSLLAGLDEAKEVVRPGPGAAGLVVMSLPVSLGLGQIAPLLPALLDKHPRLKLELRFEDRMVDLIGDGVDVAIRAGTAPPDSPFVVARFLATFERVLCAAPAFLKAQGLIAGIDALERIPCVVQGAGPTRWSFETPEGPRSIVVDGRIRTNNVLAMREAAVAGAGVAQLPLWLVAEDLRRQRLTRVLPRAVLPAVAVYGLFHHGSRGSARIRAVLDHLADVLPRGVKPQ